jgi:CHAD domain-containing protein
MVQEQIKTYFGNQIEEISSHLQVAGLPQSTEAVHDIRVCIKRIRAFLKVFDLKNKNKRIRRLLKNEISILFKTAGKLRDTEVLVYLLQEYEKLLDQDFSELEVKLSEKIDERRKILRKKLPDRQKDFLSKLRQEVIHEIESLPEEKINKLVESYLVKATKKTLKNKQRIIPKVLHRQRKLLKEIRFCIEMTDGMDSNPDTADQISRIKEMEDILGSWHDYNILNVAVVKFMQKLKKSEVDKVVKMNSLAHTVSNDIILLLDKYRKTLPNLEIKL